jgi:hypothetical protein
MAENLKTSRYSDGTSIPFVTDSVSWAAVTIPAYCFCNNQAGKKDKYGTLYNWYTVNVILFKKIL